MTRAEAPLTSAAETLAGTPEPASARALKEWAALDAALAAGATVLLLRKGGIYEQRHGFQLEHRRFWIYPTRFHQSMEELHPAFEWSLTAARAQQPETGRVRLATYAVVTDAFRVEDLAALDRLAGLHPLAQPTVHARFHYKRRPYLHVLVARAFTLAEPHSIASTSAYDGCVSWVELEAPLSTRGAAPALGEASFADRRVEVLERLGAAGVARV